MFWYWCPFLKDQDNDWARESVLFSFKMMMFSKSFEVYTLQEKNGLVKSRTRSTYFPWLFFFELF